MRFNQRNTAVAFLDQVSEKDFQFIRHDWHPLRREMLVRETVEAFRNYGHHFRKNVQYITKPFYEVFLDGAAKLVPILLEENLGEGAGTFIYNRGYGTVTAFYYYRHSADRQTIDVTIMEFITSEKGTTLESCIQILDGKMITALSDRQNSAGATHTFKVSTIIGLVAFLKYCDIETKQLKPKEKYRQQDCRYFNETKSMIEVVDCTWFTNLVRSEGFPVKAHFHWYWINDPQNPGQKKRKLNFLDTYKKEGYLKKAKALNQNL
jgi:hypothetical protein